jgi:transposase, IS6 family
MHAPALFKWRHFEAEIMLCTVRWYLRYALSYRDVEELMCERGVMVDHTTVFRWVQRYAPELDKRCRPQLNATNDSSRVDETSIKIKQHWYYLYRAGDSTGVTLDFMLSATRDADAAERFFRQVLRDSHALTPRVITVDKNAAYPPAFDALQQDSTLPETCRLRQCKYLNNMIEQDHWFVKRRVNPGLGFGAFAAAQRTIQGYEAMHMLHKGQVEGVTKGDVSPRTESSTSCLGWPPKERSAASPHAPISFCNTTVRTSGTSWRVLGDRWAARTLTTS